MTDELDVDVLWVQQATNHELVIVNLAPTHVDSRFDKTSPGHWQWRPDDVGVPVLGDDDLRPISPGERLYWWQHHVVETSRLLPFALKSLFVEVQYANGGWREASDHMVLLKKGRKRGETGRRSSDSSSPMTATPISSDTTSFLKRYGRSDRTIAELGLLAPACSVETETRDRARTRDDAAVKQHGFAWDLDPS
ncbi:hypothetical protein ACM66B_006403 [Microbotryomycetes sp. NB124-2]